MGWRLLLPPLLVSASRFAAAARAPPATAPKLTTARHPAQRADCREHTAVRNQHQVPASVTEHAMTPVSFPARYDGAAAPLLPRPMAEPAWCFAAVSMVIAATGLKSRRARHPAQRADCREHKTERAGAEGSASVTRRAMRPIPFP